MHREFLHFTLGEHHYALPVGQVAEVVPRASLTPLPGAPGGVLGLLRLRGGVVPIVDLHARIGLARSAPEIGQRIVITRGDGQPVGFLVDRVEGLIRDELTSSESANGSQVVKSVHETGAYLVTALDADALVSQTVRKYVARISGAHQYGSASATERSAS